MVAVQFSCTSARGLCTRAPNPDSGCQSPSSERRPEGIEVMNLCCDAEYIADVEILLRFRRSLTLDMNPTRSLSTHYPLTIHSLFAHYSFTFDSLFAHYSLTTRSLFAHYSLTIHSLAFTIRSLFAPRIGRWWRQHAGLLSIETAPEAINTDWIVTG